MLLAALGFLVSVAYWPGISGAATTSRWIVLGLVPLALMFCGTIRITAAHIAGSLLVGWALLTYVWSASPDDTIDAGLKLLLIASAFYFGSLQDNLRPLYAGAAAGLAISAAFAIAQLLGWHGLPEIASPSGLFANRNFYAETSAIILVALISERMWWWLPCALPGVLLTGARGAWLALIVPFIRGRMMVALLIVAIAIVAIPLRQNGWNTVKERLLSWQAVVPQIGPFGNGLGSFRETAPNAPGYRFEHPHNEFIELGFETGWVGLALFGLFFLTLIGERSTEGLVLIALLVEAMFEFPFHEPAVAFIGAIAAGYLAIHLRRSFVPAFDGRIRNGAKRWAN